MSEQNYVDKILHGLAPCHAPDKSYRDVVYGLRAALKFASNLPQGSALTGWLCDVANLIWDYESSRLVSLSAATPAKGDEWISVEDRPLFTTDEKGNWTCTDDGDREFIAAVPHVDSKRPKEKNLWWIKHCVIEDNIGLCVVGDVDNEPAGWDMKDVVYWQPFPSPPIEGK